MITILIIIHRKVVRNKQYLFWQKSCKFIIAGQAGTHHPSMAAGTNIPY